MINVVADPSINVESMMKDMTSSACLNIVSALAAGRDDPARNKQASDRSIRQYNMLFKEDNLAAHNKNLINTLGAPVFSKILGRDDIDVENISVKDTIDILNNMKIENTNSELLSSLQMKNLENCIDENNKLHVLAYASTLIGKCMTADASLAATTVNREPVALDISQRAPQALEAPKKPNWFVRHLTFLSKGFQERMDTYNAAKAKYDAEKGANEAAIAKYNDMNAQNKSSSVKKAETTERTAAAATRDPITRQELGNSVGRTTERVEPSNERQRTFEAGN